MSDKIQTPYTPRCGDHVHHNPSGEEWLVAYADYTTDRLAWFGWPNGLARLSDCEVTKRCTDDEHRKAVREWENSQEDDGRKSNVLRLYGDTT